MLTSMLLSQEVSFEGDVEDFVQQMTRHRSPVRHPLPPSGRLQRGRLACWHRPVAARLPA